MGEGEELGTRSPFAVTMYQNTIAAMSSFMQTVSLDLNKTNFLFPPTKVQLLQSAECSV